MTDLRHKVALVTGSSRGIGAAIAKCFARYGARVALHGRDVSALSRVARDITEARGDALQVTGDVTQFSDIDDSGDPEYFTRFLTRAGSSPGAQKARAAALERLLRRRIRREVAGMPTLWRQYARIQRNRRLFVLLKILAALFVAAGGVFGAHAMSHFPRIASKLHGPGPAAER